MVHGPQLPGSCRTVCSWQGCLGGADPSRAGHHPKTHGNAAAAPPPPPAPDADPCCADKLHEVPVYANVKEIVNESGQVEAIEIHYLTFYAHNGTYDVGYLGLFKVGDHDGDWEHCTVRLNGESGALEGIWYNAHRARDGSWLPASAVDREPATGRPRMYVALHGHGTYPRPSTFMRAFFLANDRCSAAGPVWRPGTCVLLPTSYSEPGVSYSESSDGHPRLHQVPSRGTSLPRALPTPAQARAGRRLPAPNSASQKGGWPAAPPFASMPSDWPIGPPSQAASQHGIPSLVEDAHSSPLPAPEATLSDSISDTPGPSGESLSLRSGQREAGGARLEEGSTAVVFGESTGNLDPSIHVSGRPQQQWQCRQSGLGADGLLPGPSGLRDCQPHNPAASPASEQALANAGNHSRHLQQHQQRQPQPLQVCADAADEQASKKGRASGHDQSQPFMACLANPSAGCPTCCDVQLVDGPAEWVRFRGEWGTTLAPISQGWFHTAETPVSRSAMLRLLMQAWPETRCV